MICEIGVLGLGVMGSSLAENFIRNGFPTALYSREPFERDRFARRNLSGYVMTDSLAAFAASLQRPRRIVMMITAGPAVDAVKDAIAPYLEEGDILVDGGNSYYEDTNRRTFEYAQLGLNFVGMGVSGGERGALEGPSMMVGGSDDAWKALAPYLQKAAAKAGDVICCNHVGEGGSGHYVKMVHNGIEYAVMELIAETWQLLREGYELREEEIADLFDGMKDGRLSSYLAEITAKVLRYPDEDGSPLVEKILPVAGQKGTGKWTTLESVERGVYTPMIYESASVRSFSEHRTAFPGYGSGYFLTLESDCDTKVIEDALYLGIVCCYAQGLSLIRKASETFGWNINLAASASLWEGGCIIRSEMLKDIVAAYEEDPQLENLLFSERFGDLEQEREALQEVCASAMLAHIPAPAYQTAVTYYDACFAPELNLAMVQGLRDCFGAHTYRRIDQEGVFHTEWEK